MTTPDLCPHCGADLDGGPVPDELIAGGGYAPGARWSRKNGISNGDRVVRWQCPDCGEEWGR